MVAWWLDRVLPSVVVFALTTPLTIWLATRRQTTDLKGHLDTTTADQTDDIVARIKQAVKPGNKGHDPAD